MAKAKAATKNGKTFQSGYCSNGQHEGSNLTSPSGNGLPVCLFWQTCKCKCHEQITAMYELAGVERIPAQQNPKYIRPRNEFVMPDAPVRDPEPVRFEGERIRLAVIDEVASMPAPAPAPSPSSNGVTRARGGLEQQVWTVCARWNAIKEQGPEACTPKWVSEEIVTAAGGLTPSTGAIQAVWDRWENLGIATQAKKPARFTGFTEGAPATWEELERLKARKKAEAKRTRSAQARGFR